MATGFNNPPNRAIGKDAVQATDLGSGPESEFLIDRARLVPSLAKHLADEIITCQPLSIITKAGASHHHFLLRGKKSSYVLKIFPREPFAISRNIMQQRKFYDFFHRHGVMTPGALHGDSQWLVLPLLSGVSDGRLVTQKNYADDDLTESLAQQLAIIHDSKHDFRQNFPDLCCDETLPAWLAQKNSELEKLFKDARPMDDGATRAATRAIEKLWASMPENLWFDMVPCHGDFRTGNFLLQANTGDGAAGQKLVAVLDWEMAGLGLAAEDIGWLSAPCWLYHQPQLTCGGIGKLEVFLQHYLFHRKAPPQAGDKKITIAAIMAQNHWFQALAMIRWGLILSKQWHRKQHGLDKLPELPQEKPDVAELFKQAQQLLG
ncbi:MAG: aminoglycoside phosphotransferase family protein [Hydrotalea sp.]|nr:aminoglycoside phosphotransferase family protein [Hydrotalea sp.]